MRKSGIISLVVVALGVGTMGMERAAQAMVGDILVMAVGEPTDPNAPALRAQADPVNVWVPAENVVATWESVTVMSKLYNPAAQREGTVPERSLSLSARVDVIDVNGLLGFDSIARGTLVLDETPRVVYSAAIPSRYCHFYWPLRYTKTMPTPGQWVSELQPYDLTVDIPIDPNRPYPVLLSRVEWSMYALVNTEAKTVDVPFGPTADWLTLAPGLEIKVEQATAESGKYQYRLATRYSRSKVLWAPSGAAISLWTHEPTPEVIVTKLDVLDSQGNSIKDAAGSSSSGSGSSASGSSAGGTGGSSASGSSTSGSNANASGTGSSSASASSASGAGGSSDLTTGTVSGMSTCSICGTATTFRFTLALKPQQQQLRFILENVPVPSL